MSPGIAVPRQELEVVAVAPAQWRQACLRELERGARFCGAYAVGHGEEKRWRALFALGSATRALTVEVPGRGWRRSST